jgi:branched-chain amino acid aminotransferase
MGVSFFCFFVLQIKTIMTEAMEILINKAETSKLKELDLNNLPFGKYFTDHMLEADYENGEWKNIEIKPYQPLLISPSIAALHYGQAIFEGIKAYRHANGDAFIFRPQDNFKRFNISAERMQMPTVSEELFMEGMRQLVALDKSWIPEMHDHSLYIRPFMFSSDEMIGVRPSENYKFMIINCPTGPYYASPMRIYVEEKFVRAVPGGVGYAKVAGNYGASMMATAEAKKKGYDQVLWTDAVEHRYVQEIGTMNVFFIINNTVITPDLGQGTILEGVSRASAITLLQEMGYKIEERPISIDEIMDAYKKGNLLEVFGTGTAATISLIRELRYKDFVMEFDTSKSKAGATVKSWLTDIREGRREDKYGWMFKV